MMSEPSDHRRIPLWHEIVTIAHRARQLWKLIPRRQRMTLAAAIGLMALGSLSNMVVPLLLGKLVDTVRQVPDHSSLESFREILSSPFAVATGFYLLLIGASYVIREALSVARRYMVEDTCTRLERHLFVQLISHVLMADLETLSQEKVGTLHAKVTRSVGGSLRFLRVGFLDFLPALLTGLFALLLVLFKQPWLAAVMAGVIPLSLLLTLRQLFSQKDVRLELLQCHGDLNGTVVELFQGIDYIRAAHTHQREVQRVAQVTEALRAKALRHHFVMSLYGSGKALNEGFFYILTLGLAIYLATIGNISVGDILTFSMLYLNVMAPLNEVHRVIDEGHESSLLVGELLKMLAEPADRSYQTTSSREPLLNGEPIIRMTNLRVDYTLPDDHHKHALEGISLAIRRGEIIGIAGRSGCGKTTFLRTLMRLVHPQSGEALIGGIPLEAVSREWIARLVGYVGQNPFVFAGKIADNIAYEQIDASLDDIRRAAQMACLDQEIQEIPGGYQALLDERGQNLSGGQKQRLALARVFLKNPPILILDEATSALDTINERHIQEALSSTRGDRTIILVAHRLSTLLHTDRILVFEDGKIVETGTYEELVQLGGVFSELVRSAEADST